MKFPRLRLHREDGQSAVEFALVAPFMLAFIMFTIDAGLLARSVISASHAVREGARCATVGGTDLAVKNRITQASTGARLVTSATNPSISRAATLGSTVTVTAQYEYRWITPVNIIPGLNLSTYNYTRTTVMRMETGTPYTKTTC